jgi:hypothetical protein
MAKKRTPSPRFIAAKLLRNIFEPAYFKSASELSLLVESKISEEKREKVMVQLDKFTNKFSERIRRVLDLYEKPPPRRQKGSDDV